MSKSEASIAEKIVDAVFIVHKVLGRGRALVFLSILTYLLLKTASIELYYNPKCLAELFLIIFIQHYIILETRLLQDYLN